MASQQDIFVAAVLKSLGMPTTQANVNAMTQWMAAEGNSDQLSTPQPGPSWARGWNPWNTTLAEGASGETGSQGDIRIYPNEQAGVKATADTLKGYSGILSALKQGDNAAGVKAAVIASPWDGSSHYAGTAYAEGAPAGGGSQLMNLPGVSAGNATPATVTTPGTDNISSRNVSTPAPPGPQPSDLLSLFGSQDASSSPSQSSTWNALAGLMKSKGQ